MIGLIGAMEREVAAMVERLSDHETVTVSDMVFHTGTLGGKPVVVARCGVGKVFAALCTQTMILRFHPAMILTTGIAGGLTEGLEVGDIAIADKVVQHDMDTSAVGDPVGMISGINVITIDTDPCMVRTLCTAGQAVADRVLVGTIASGDQFVADRKRKEEIVARFGAIACEMETAAIGQVCYVNHVPFGSLQVISDSFSGSGGMEYDQFCEMAAGRSIAAAEAFCREVEA